MSDQRSDDRRPPTPGGQVRITRRAALVGAGSLAASGGVLAAAQGLAAASAPTPLMVPAAVEEIQSATAAEVVPMGGEMAVEATAASAEHLAGTSRPADFRGFAEDGHVLVITGESLPPGAAEGNGDPEALGPVTARQIVPMSLGSVEDLASR